MSTLFISDLHLEDRQPDTTGWLLEFLDGPARNADAVYILGDLFEFWIGDDALSTTARRVAEASAALVASGVVCFFIHGNRDFLLGDSYAMAAGLTLLPESLVIDLYGTPTLLLHGDTLCTDDIEYQTFRQQSRNPAWQAGILSLSVEERLKMARSARDASKLHTGAAAMEIMDVNESSVRNSFREHGVKRMIHGHTHRPAFHKYKLDDGSEAERIVLADWYTEGSYLSVTEEGIESFKLEFGTSAD
jgi:UDP-2,3-diacylglucosamine hydrolase